MHDDAHTQSAVPCQILRPQHCACHPAAAHLVREVLDRDVRFTLIGGGTSEILRGAIARGLAP